MQGRLTQCQKIVKYLKRHKDITTMQAFQEFGITRLASRICDLEKSGYEIGRKWKSVKAKDGTSVNVVAYSLKVAK